MRSKDAHKQLARTSLIAFEEFGILPCEQSLLGSSYISQEEEESQLI